MKTTITIEISDSLLRRAKSAAAQRGVSLELFMSEALAEKLAPARKRPKADEPAWMSGFGRLRRLHRETTRIQAVIDETFGTLAPEDLR